QRGSQRGFGVVGRHHGNDLVRPARQVVCLGNEYPVDMEYLIPQMKVRAVQDRHDTLSPVPLRGLESTPSAAGWWMRAHVGSACSWPYHFGKSSTEIKEKGRPAGSLRMTVQKLHLAMGLGTGPCGSVRAEALTPVNRSAGCCKSRLAPAPGDRPQPCQRSTATRAADTRPQSRTARSSGRAASSTSSGLRPSGRGAGDRRWTRYR